VFQINLTQEKLFLLTPKTTKKLKIIIIKNEDAEKSFSKP
jgi:hypothetical protein